MYPGSGEKTMDEDLIEIIKLCLAIDENASKIYLELSEAFASDELSAIGSRKNKKMSHIS